MTLQIPRYTGPGSYDLTAHGQDIDPLDYELALGYRDEGFFWSPDTGRGTVEVAAGEQELTTRLEMQGAAGDLSVTATIALPPIRDPRAERDAAAAEERRAYLAVLPKAAVQLSVSGTAATGSWSGELAAMVSQERGDTGAVTLQLALATAETPAPQLGGLPLLGLRLEVPQYTGPGHYDLSTRSDGLDPESNIVVLGSEDEPFCWAPRVGPGSVDLGADGRTVDVRMATRGQAGDLQLTATIRLPEALTPA